MRDVSLSTPNKYIDTTGTLQNSSSSATSDYIKVNANTSYIISGYGTNNAFKCVAFYDSSKTYITTNSVTNTSNTYIITTPNNASYLRFHYPMANEDIVQIEKGTKVNHTSTTPIELCKIGTYQDYIYKDNGSWYLHKEIGKVVLDGSENWSIQTTWSAVGDLTNAFYITKPTDLNANAPSYCNYLQYKSNVAVFLATDEFGLTYSASLIVRMPKSLTDVNALKTWLSNNNVKVYYVLATPTNTLIEDTTLIEQLEALSS